MGICDDECITIGPMMFPMIGVIAPHEYVTVTTAMQPTSSVGVHEMFTPDGGA